MAVMLKALLLTRDQEVLRVIRRMLEMVAIDLENVTRIRLGFGADVQSGCEVVREMRRGKSNAKSIVFAITNRVTSVKEAFSFGANFVLEKPISADRAARSLRAAHGLIMRERRRYHRHALQTTVRLTYGSQRDVPMPLSNISEGGLALATKHTPDMQGPVAMRFELPGSSRSLDAKGEFVWISDTGKVGVRFTTLPAATKAELDSWLRRQLEFVAPGLIGAGR